MTWFIFIGDLLVMAGMIAVAAWAFLRANPADLNAAARIPLDDDGGGEAVIPEGRETRSHLVIPEGRKTRSAAHMFSAYPESLADWQPTRPSNSAAAERKPHA